MKTFIIKLDDLYYAGTKETEDASTIGALGVTYNQGARDEIILSNQPLVIRGNINLKSHILTILDRMRNGELDIQEMCILKTV